METLTIEITNPNAYALLKDLELLQILKIIKEPLVEDKIKLSEKYKGVFTDVDANSFDLHTVNSREEWKGI